MDPQGPGPGRGLTAFTIISAVDRQNGTADITALAVDSTGRRLFLGLADGGVEEHRLRPTPSGALAASLVSRRQLCKAAVAGLHFLPAGGGRVAVLSADGGVLLADAASLEAAALPVRHAVAAAVDASPAGRPPRLAVVTRPNKRTLRVAVYEVAAEARGSSAVALVAQADVPDASGRAVGGAAWVAGAGLVLCCGPRYLLAAPAPPPGAGQWRELLVVPEELAAAAPTAVAALPALRRAVLLAGTVGVVVDAGGQPVGSSLPLDALPPVRSLAGSGAQVLAVCEDGIHVLDIGGQEVEEVQLMGFGPGVKPAPGQPLFAASNAAGSCVAVAGRRKAWACLPTSAEERARQLMARGDLRPAVAVVEEAAQRGEAWTETGSAQAALLLMQGADFEGAAALLERCPPVVFQPAAELPPLFPQHTQPWAGRLPAPARYWGLHKSLPSLRTLIGRWAPHGPGRPGGPPPSVDTSRGDDASVQPDGGDGGTEVLDDAAQRRERAALDALVQYLFRVRVMAGVACPDVADSLLLHLLIDLGAVRQAAAFAAVPNRVQVDAVAGRLQALGWHHALASLWAARGDAEAALRLWRSVVDGSAAALDPGVRAAEQREALESAVALLADGAACPEGVLLQYVPWLLAASQPDAVRVLHARALTPDAVLPLLPRDSDARWQYLEQYLGQQQQQQQQQQQPGGGPPPDPALPTELATELAAAVLRAAPELADAAAAPRRPAAQRGSRRGSRTTADLVGGLAAAAASSGAVAALRAKLLRHLEASPAVDHSLALGRLAGTALHEEQVVLHAKLGDHMAVLRLLALTLRDAAAAVAYATAHLPPSEYRALLALVLDPGDGQEPHYDDAAYLIAALGEHLDAMEVVAALPLGMPLATAVSIVAPVLRDRTHRRRQGLVAKNLQRAALGAAREARAAAEGARVTIDDERACPHCHLRLGGKVFVVLRGEGGARQQQLRGGEGGAPPPSVCCYNCYRRIELRDGGQPAGL